MSLFLGIPETIRHLSVETSNPKVLKSVERFKNLQTLHITDEYDSNLFGVLIKIFQVIGSIRLLHLNYSFELKKMPEEIRYLQHLRYLRFSALNVELLPRSLSSLYHLQFLIFDDHHQSNYLSNNYFPRDMNNLLNLRYLSYSKLNFPGIGKLKLLQKLDFIIKNENGYRVDELEHMNELSYLRIMNLENVRNAEEASIAKLFDKRKLTILTLIWDLVDERYNPDRDLYERVLDNLQPHCALKDLKIVDYMGARSAIWMNEAHLINNLEVIELYNFLEWEFLPPFGQLPFLKTLWLQNMPKVKRLENKFHGNEMCSAFPSLQTLHFYNLKALVDWFDASVVDALFPCLTYLYLSQCPNLQELPYLPPKLESLLIKNIGWKTLNCCSISKSIPLKKLEVYRCPNITSISPCVFPSLESLYFYNLEALVDWFDASVDLFPCLTTLYINDCPNLQELPYLPPKLESFENK